MTVSMFWRGYTSHLLSASIRGACCFAAWRVLPSCHVKLNVRKAMAFCGLGFLSPENSFQNMSQNCDMPLCLLTCCLVISKHHEYPYINVWLTAALGSQSIYKLTLWSVNMMVLHLWPPLIRLWMHLLLCYLQIVVEISLQFHRYKSALFNCCYSGKCIQTYWMVLSTIPSPVLHILLDPSWHYL